ncbi:hypothetical protein CLAIMM_07362 [Cladophialophora immunda]|nr:hypothetical protein CLAIMM_07362 [Cladophialophora immunda]
MRTPNSASSASCDWQNATRDIRLHKRLTSGRGEVMDLDAIERCSREAIIAGVSCVENGHHLSQINTTAASLLKKNKKNKASPFEPFGISWFSDLKRWFAVRMSSG